MTLDPDCLLDLNITNQAVTDLCPWFYHAALYGTTILFALAILSFVLLLTHLLITHHLERCSREACRRRFAGIYEPIPFPSSTETVRMYGTQKVSR